MNGLGSYMTQGLRGLEAKVPPPLMFMLVGGAMWGISQVLPGGLLSGSWRIGMALGIGAIGLGIAGSGIAAFRRAKTTISPTRPDTASRIVSRGIYGYTRNPIYVGLSALLLGWSAWLNVPWVLLGPAFFILYTTRFQIIPEERVLTVKFGEEYIDYRNRVRRWI